MPSRSGSSPSHCARFLPRRSPPRGAHSPTRCRGAFPLLSGREVANARLAFIAGVDAIGAFVQILVSDRELRTILVSLVVVLGGLIQRAQSWTTASSR